NFTSFYREPQHYDFLLTRALRDIAARKEALSSRRIRAWSAAAATGEEPYSLGMTFLEYFKDPSLWDIKILATDISSKVLNEAFEGLYTKEQIKAVSPSLRQRYFDSEPAKKGCLYRIKDQVKRLIVFRRLNLMDAAFPFQGPFDFIFCRNLLIYFDLPTQEAVIRKLLKYLEVGGYLFVGHSENLPMVFRGQVETLACAVYRKIK
ncbi:MAG: protein-glutamate O-methyltransferase CheR, partial [Candidatus Omnitrophica bacterium]|nr:protein-glutamate O-methyltransferase CheR [Candidatus Omnitrophota bacterium]